MNIIKLFQPMRTGPTAFVTKEQQSQFFLNKHLN